MTVAFVAFITTYTDVLQFFVVLPEESRAQAIRISGQPGGDGVAAFVDILTNTIMDIGQNPNVVNQSLQLTESPDEIKPMIVILLLITVGIINAADCSTSGGSATCADAGNMAVSIYNDPVSIVEN